MCFLVAETVITGTTTAQDSRMHQTSCGVHAGLGKVSVYIASDMVQPVPLRGWGTPLVPLLPVLWEWEWAFWCHLLSFPGLDQHLPQACTSDES